MRRLRYNDAARDDLLAIARYIRLSSGNSEIARSFVSSLRIQCEKIAALPGTIGRTRSELRSDLRSFAFKGYVILFRYVEDTVEVVNILERHRDIAAEFKTEQS
ncbi:type II toxin-antitoxin system RelE/ParE family toxin [Bosea sp. 685]|uniref:type II toxin-antitoxin system RelE/ParE family toxin n=1 Tax=Bosea sp. 685 TaxID=3080057 RepID=UPI0028935B94|nr:type II toxin-antitoxin system RelE/ParE family toxin [Bosea sp. 685]WNJ89559.1 type II toxin-antitoxin system RelE/ParE family toxin [Bosea sp. 685]